MAQCTAPVRGHRSSAAAANCPACRGRSRSYGYGGYSGSTYREPRRPSYGSGGRSGGGGSSRPRWSGSTSVVVYTPAEVRSLTPIRETVERRGLLPEKRDVFLCHAWDDRQDAAKLLHDSLESQGVSVWVSEKDVVLGVPLMRAIDRGLANSRIGLVLVTPSFIERIRNEGVADKELSELLARDQIVPIVHGTTYEALRDVSPLLASRSGLDTTVNNMQQVAVKISELVALEV